MAKLFFKYLYGGPRPSAQQARAQSRVLNAMMLLLMPGGQF